MLMLVGTYTRGTDSLGIYGFEFNSATISFSGETVHKGIDNPSYLLKHPELPVIYCVNEVRNLEGEGEGEGEDEGEGGSISAFDLSVDGKLTLINQVPSLGSDPCHLEFAHEGRLLLVSNYTSGTLAAIPLSDTGELGNFNNFIQHTGHSVDPMRQKTAHVHSIKAGKNNTYIYVADLGLDQILRYPLDGAGHANASQRSTTRMRPGAGPRHFCFDAVYKYCYVINELDNTIVSFAVNDDGLLVELATVGTLPADYQDASYCGEIQLSADDHFLYGSNRGHDSLVVFEVLENGVLQWVQHIDSGGVHPRHFKMTPSGSHLIAANRDTNNLVIFERDESTGKLDQAGIELSVPAPVCILFV